MKQTRPIFFRTAIVTLLLTLSFAASLYAQSIARGKVVDSQGKPVPGASVKGVPSGSATLSDPNGNFSLNTPAGDSTITVSFIGYQTQQVRIGQNLTVTLAEQASTLQEVVVVGYGTQRRSDVTGSVASIKGDDLRSVPAPNAVAALQGRLPGVDIARNSSRPGAGGQIRIRGTRSLSNTNDPFIVLDGIPFSGSINDINPNDIASIDVLKDASSTAIYGFRGANGVILITTNRGRKGKPQLNYNAYTGPSNVIAQYRLFNGPEFVAFRSAASPAYTAGYSPTELAGIANGTSTNWQDYLYRTGTVMEHNIGVSGGSEGVNYALSGGYYNDKGVIKGLGFERYSLNSSIDATINKHVKVGLTTRNILSYNNGQGVNPLYATLRITPLAPAFNADGSMFLKPQLGTVDETETLHPLTLNDTDNIVDRNRRIRTFNQVYGEVAIVQGLKYRVNVGLDFRQENRGTWFGPNTIIRPNVAQASGGTSSLSNGEAWTATVENILTYDRTLWEDHRISVTGLYSFQRDRGFTNAFNNASGFPSSEIQYYNFGLAATPAIAQDGGSTGFYRTGLQSFMGRLNYIYKDRYMATVTFRRDGSSVFPVNPYLNYPAFALGWNISNESFMDNVTAVSNLKLRATYGVTGNPGIPNDATRGSLSTNRYTYGSQNVSGYYITSLPNLNLRWESTKQYNLALDYGFLANRISGSIEVYKMDTEDLIISKQLPRSNGVNSYYTNAAATSGKGVEFSISSVNIDNKKSTFKWTTDFNFGINRSKIERLADETTVRDIGNGWFVGQPIDVIYDYTKLGIWQTSEAVEAARFGAIPGQIKLADISGPAGIPDGAITDADRSIIGTFQPDIVMGMAQGISFKGFDLSAVAAARLGNKIAVPYLSTNGSGTGYFAILNGRVNMPKVDYWTPTNPTNDFPRPAGGATNIPYSSTLTYFDGSFIKMRSINLGYSVPAKWISKIGASAIRVYASAVNPFIIYSPFVRSGYGIDPEGTGTGGTVDTQAVNARAITVGLDVPSTRQFLFGVNVRF
ncbi:SusC/RagA family TonB-linked outer membrane protein [Hufsiella ginkgonis]|uniref:SusC/RagA family TonB-linked outer membrane protein n=1 Tax=Hufsiella ginkgonis TaxID=2695274 RepID=A0A7K1XUP2_9SPHI|nr:TonB-dependent receptor [Hufsiella ginkgonis]MXV14518.1 SusC/RagA family TonB-linked outer membrane protein [Hufsiella ginkgonis]